MWLKLIAYFVFFEPVYLTFLLLRVRGDHVFRFRTVSVRASLSPLTDT